MSDYFGALLRSAGALPRNRPRPGGAAAPAGTAAFGAAAGESAFEQVVEVEAPPRRDAPGPAETAAPSSRADAVVGSSPVAQATPAPPAATPAAGPGIPPSPARMQEASSLAPAAADGTVHPLVQAALRWVRADAPAGEAPAPPPASEPSTRTVLDSFPPSPAAVRPNVPDPAPPRVRVAQAPASVAHPDLALDLELLRPSLPAKAATHAADSDPAAPPPSAPRFELSIGTIHVSVDAPPAPRPVAQTVAPAPRPPARPQSAPRSDLSRSRLPRF